MRLRRTAAAIAALTLACLVASCGSSSTVRSAPPTPHVSFSALPPSPVPTESGPHAYTAGADGMGDPLFPTSGNGGYDVGHYAVTIAWDPVTGVLTGDDVVTATATQNLSKFDLDLRGLTVTSVTINGTAAAFTRGDDKLVVTPAHGIDIGSAMTVHVMYGGVPKKYSDPKLGDEGFLTYFPQEAVAQGEPQVAATWYAVNDHPRDKATYDITVTAPSALAALSNGVLAGKKVSGATTTWHWVENKPMASYLAMVAIGKYRVTMSTHNGLPVVNAVDASLPQTIDPQIAQTPQIIDFLATQFGPYPFDAEGGIVQSDREIPFALENQTRPVYSSEFFPEQGQNLGVIAHELAHQWYGDSVSVANWSDVWLNEGFATYAEWLWAQHTGGPTPLESFNRMYATAGKGGLPLSAPAIRTQANLFDNAVYDRGAATLEALRITIGDKAFFQIIRQWAAQRQYGNGSTAEFIALANQVSGKSLDSFFHAWLYTAAKPPAPKPMS
jgi:aminopeptidase N